MTRETFWGKISTVGHPEEERIERSIDLMARRRRPSPVPSHPTVNDGVGGGGLHSIKGDRDKRGPHVAQRRGQKEEEKVLEEKKNGN